MNVNLKKRLLVLAIITYLAVSTPLTAHATYPVIDHENIAKTIEVIKKTSEQIEKLNEQVNLAKQHLSIVTQSMKDVSDGAKSVFKAIDGTRTAVDGVIKNTRSSFEGLLSPVNDVQKVAEETEAKWNKTFMSLSTLSPKNITYGALQGSNAYINAQVTKNNKEAVVETQTIIAGLTQAEDELQQLREQARQTVGQRDLAKINAEIDAVTARINSFNSKLTAIQVTNQNIESQARQQQEANRTEYNFAAAKRLSETVTNMKSSIEESPTRYESRAEYMKSKWK